MSCNDQGTEFEFTVVQKFNQGSFPKSGGNRFRGSFFVKTNRPYEKEYYREAIAGDKIRAVI